MAILLVEDEQDLADIVGYTLRRSGHEVITAYDGMAALRLLKSRAPQLVILDVNLPHVDGWQVLHQIRTSSATPVIMLTARSTDQDVVKGLRLGADDYVTKPFSPVQLVARVEAVLRRAAPEAGTARARALELGDIVLDVGLQRARVRGHEVRLTKIEFRLLYELALREGEVVTHQELTRRIWGLQDVESASMAKSHIRNLRRKIEPLDGSFRYIHTIPGLGYRLASRQREPAVADKQPA
ncbi:MAG TPA: response regulator transcription factor [Dehalococcoidia bacterium]|nr:response regulator transcription factor [Dehalococcoidia bacterium]